MGVRWPLTKKERQKAKVRLQPSKIKQNFSGDWGQCTNNVTGSAKQSACLSSVSGRDMQAPLHPDI